MSNQKNMFSKIVKYIGWFKQWFKHLYKLRGTAFSERVLWVYGVMCKGWTSPLTHCLEVLMPQCSEKCYRGRNTDWFSLMVFCCKALASLTLIKPSFFCKVSQLWRCSKLLYEEGFYVANLTDEWVRKYTKRKRSKKKVRMSGWWPSRSCESGKKKN